MQAETTCPFSTTIWNAPSTAVMSSSRRLEILWIAKIAPDPSRATAGAATHSARPRPRVARAAEAHALRRGGAGGAAARRARRGDRENGGLLHRKGAAGGVMVAVRPHADQQGHEIMRGK